MRFYFSLLFLTHLYLDYEAKKRIGDEMRHRIVNLGHLSSSNSNSFSDFEDFLRTKADHLLDKIAEDLIMEAVNIVVSDDM